jgi:type IV secretory pathway TrbD component
LSADRLLASTTLLTILVDKRGDCNSYIVFRSSSVHTFGYCPAVTPNSADGTEPAAAAASPRWLPDAIAELCAVVVFGAAFWRPAPWVESAESVRGADAPLVPFYALEKVVYFGLDPVVTGWVALRLVSLIAAVATVLVLRRWLTAEFGRPIGSAAAVMFVVRPRVDVPRPRLATADNGVPRSGRTTSPHAPSSGRCGTSESCYASRCRTPCAPAVSIGSDQCRNARVGCCCSRRGEPLRFTPDVGPTC